MNFRRKSMLLLGSLAFLAGCSADGSGSPGASGGVDNHGGAGSGATPAGGTTAGIGIAGTAGSANSEGGAATSAGSGGRPTIGGSGGTSDSGGATAGGASGAGGASASGGEGSSLPDSRYWLGVDVSFEETQPEATREALLSTLKAHGINSVRLRTFVDPTAADGYNKSGACDLAHTIGFGKQIKAAGMSFLLDFHYSDNWADPGKQCVPIAWQGYTTVAQLATAMHDYTKDAITQLIEGGARPDMVQIGNETTPGLLIHRCDGSGKPTGSNPVSGSTSNWANLGPLLKAGVDGVKEVDSKILVAFHIAKGGDHTDGSSALQTSVTWLTNALKYTPVDAFGESCYQTYQGDESSTTKTKTIWQNTEGGLASKFPKVRIFAAEYGSAERELNDVIFNLPNQQGLGSFYWEPTLEGDWNRGHTLLSRSGSMYLAKPDLALYDQMKADYASRL
ncbi:MAG TPA: glycosyl hydrolase 53 family protein [Polyangiaceae bacterium]|nr:glycosyl hydrolase 53 family protein [Polyangiaceae bacterium]